MKKSQLRKIIQEEIKDVVNESGYVELMDIDDHLEAIHYEWEKWRDGPMTEPEDIGRARADILSYIQSYLERSLK
jgi:hypothetical protein